MGTSLESCLDRGLDFLHRAQLPHGELRAQSLRCGNPAGEVWKDDGAVFVTALIVHSLGLVDEPRAESMIWRALGFLRAEMRDSGLWAYWTRANGRYIPPDLDDTAYISSILRQYGVAFPDNRELLLNNRDGGGLFQTWIFDPPAEHIVPSRLPRQIVDPVVNANVLAYLGHHDETECAVTYLNRVAKDLVTSTFYLDEMCFLYMLSRAYRLGIQALLPAGESLLVRLSQRWQQGSSGNVLLDALGVCALLNFSRPDERLPWVIESLVRSQNDDGSWERFPMYQGGDELYGAAELTSAICLEALARFRLDEGRR